MLIWFLFQIIDLNIKRVKSYSEILKYNQNWRTEHHKMLCIRFNHLKYNNHVLGLLVLCNPLKLKTKNIPLP